MAGIKFSSRITTYEGLTNGHIDKAYTELAGSPINRAVVFYRDQVRMSDIAQLRREFARLRRDDLLILNFIDLFHAVAKESQNFEQLSIQQRRFLASEFNRLSQAPDDPKTLRYLFSKIMRYTALRYPEAEYDPLQILAPIVVFKMAGLLKAETGLWGSQIIFERLDGGEYVVDSIRQGEIIRGTIPEARIAKLARIILAVNRMVLGPPCFYRTDRGLPPVCVFSNKYKYSFPPKFLQSPSAYIESCEGLEAIEGDMIDGLNVRPRDISRIKKLSLADERGNRVACVSKRIEPLRVSSIEEEMLNADIVTEALRQNNIAGCATAQYLGLVYDAGNFYLLMNDENAPTIFEEYSSLAQSRFDQAKQVLGGKHDDLEERNALWRKDQLILIDFESHVRAYGREQLAPFGDVFALATFSSVASASRLQQLMGGQSCYFLDRFQSALNLLRADRGELPSMAALSDVHGNSRRLGQILDHPAVSGANEVVYEGDLFDRDPNGDKVFKLIKDRPQKEVFVLGNHEITFAIAMRGYLQAFLLFIKYGGLEFLSTVLDISQLQQTLNEGSKKHNEDCDIIDLMAEEDPTPFTRAQTAMRAHPFFREVSSWIIDHCRLFHFDRFCNLHIHAGIMPVSEPDLGFLDELKQTEIELFSALKDPAPAATDRAVELAKHLSPYLEARENDWLVPYAQMGKDQANEALYGLGLRSVIYGHTPRSHPTITLEKFFGIDLSMAEGYGGFLHMGDEGISIFQFLDSGSDALTEKVVMDGKQFRRLLSEDANNLVQSFQRYFILRC